MQSHSVAADPPSPAAAAERATDQDTTAAVYASTPTSATSTASSIPFRPALSGRGDGYGRPVSIQFAPRLSDPGLPTGSPKPTTQERRRMSSPPPPASFQSRVSFDTFDNKDASDFSLTLNSKHRDYQYTRRSRTFLCGTDQNDYSEFALEWLIDELVDDGDEIVCLRVVDKDAKISSDASVEEGRYRTEAKKLLDHIISKNTEGKAISLILEFAVGKVHDTIQHMIRVYEPAILVVGTRGRNLGGIQGLLPGSVSKYCLQHSPVPVIVVRPTSKREKKKRKRQADPSRKSYVDILEKSRGQTLYLLDEGAKSNLSDKLVAGPEGGGLASPSDDVSSAGVSPLTQTHFNKAEVTLSEPLSPAEESPLTASQTLGVVMNSPALSNFDSPVLSDEDESGDEARGEDDGPGHQVTSGPGTSQEEGDRPTGQTGSGTEAGPTVGSVPNTS